MPEITSQLSTALADRYRIERHLGQGGMATVYLAHDVKHDRKVALKVLRPELAAVIGADRFLQEIKVTANLQHPHILPLHDSGEADNFLYYVMPYVEGDTLRDKLDTEKQLDIDEAVEITRAISGALDYAHRQDVIHRDIKPENILLHDGQAMVADFGIALAVSQASGQRLTETGLSIGTPHYMSPEQAMGDRELDARSDVYSVGAMLYEMLAGDPPYTGNSAQAIVAKVITEKAPPVTATRDTVPGHVAAAIAKALAKMPADRFKSAADFAAALTNPAFTAATVEPVAAAIPADETNAPVWRRAVMPAAIAVLAVLAAMGWLRSTDPLPVTRLDLNLGPMTAGQDVVISPDGSMLAVSGTVDGETAIYVRRLDEADFVMVPGTEGGIAPSFSPDNQWLVFRNDVQRSLVRVSVSGGGALTLVDEAEVSAGWPHWGEDGTIVFTGAQGLHTTTATGAPPTPVAPVFVAAPHVLPDGSGVLAHVNNDVYLFDLKAGSDSPLIPDARFATYVSTGHVLYTTSGGLFAVPFDLGRHEITGPPARVLDRVATTFFRAGYSVSRNGTLVHFEGATPGPGGGAAPNLVLIVARDGTADTLRLPPGVRRATRFSNDGQKIAYEFGGGAGGHQLYTYDLVTNTNTQITFDGDNDDPIWSPDGTRILFNLQNDSTDQEDIWVKPADNSGPAELILSRPDNQYPVAWFATDSIVFVSSESGNDDLFIYELSGSSEPVPYLQAPWDEAEFALSPDGDLAAHTSDKTGDAEVWLRDFPQPQGEWRVSFGGGSRPRWSPDGRTLYFWTTGAGPDSLMAARVDRDQGVVVHAAEVVQVVQGLSRWDLHPDGERFLVVVNPPAPATTESGPMARYLVVLNWFEELKQRVGN